MRIKLLTIALLLFSFIRISQAQSLNGISIHSNEKEVVVLLNSQPMCEATHSCFIANLPAGNYRIEVFSADDMKRHESQRRILYFNKLRYNGKGVQHIQVGSNSGHHRNQYDNDYDEDYDRYRFQNIMGKRDFQDFCQHLEEANFDNNRMEMFDLLPRQTKFTSRQCRDLVRILDFDSNKATLLKRLYPQVVDKETFYLAIDELEFISYQNEVKEFVQNYNRRHR